MNRRNAIRSQQPPGAFKKWLGSFNIAAIGHLLNASGGTEKPVRLARGRAQKKLQVWQWTTLN